MALTSSLPIAVMPSSSCDISCSPLSSLESGPLKSGKEPMPYPLPPESSPASSSLLEHLQLYPGSRSRPRTFLKEFLELSLNRTTTHLKVPEY